MKNISYNVFFSVFSHVITICLSLIIPRMILVNYGSEVNGLISTVTQIFVYLALIEAGVGNATMNMLFKPLLEKDLTKINQILSISKENYKKISYQYLIFTIIIAFAFPMLIEIDLDKIVVFFFILLQGITGSILFYFFSVYKQLLISDGKNFIVVNINLIVHFINSSIKLYLIINGFNVLLLQVSFLFITIIQVLIIIHYCKKKYPWIYFEKVKTKDLTQKKAFMFHEISGAIFSSTDILIISLFLDLKTASVYAIYSMVFISINSILNIINTSLSYLLGNEYHKKNKGNYIKLHDTYETVFISLVFVLNSTAFIMILPFISLYTKGIKDINYLDYKMAILFCLIQLMSNSRAISARLILIADHASKTVKNTIIEATLNLFLSLILVNFYGVYGVLFATIIALLYRMNDIIFYANKIILRRNVLFTYKLIFLNSFVFLFVIICNYFFNLKINSYFDFFVNSIYIFLINLITFTFFNFLINKKIFLYLWINIKKYNFRRKT